MLITKTKCVNHYFKIFAFDIPEKIMGKVLAKVTAIPNDFILYNRGLKKLVRNFITKLYRVSL